MYITYVVIVISRTAKKKYKLQTDVEEFKGASCHCPNYIYIYIYTCSLTNPLFPLTDLTSYLR